MRKLFRSPASIAVALALAAPLSAQAVYFDYAFVETKTQQIIGVVTNTGQSIVTQITARISQAEMMIVKAIQDSQNAATSSSEKQLGGQKELQQASLTYDALQATKEAAAEAEDMVGTEETHNSMCDTAATTNMIAAAVPTATVATKAYSATLTARALKNTDTGKIQKELLDEHGDKYCSDDDAKRKRCSGGAAPSHMQNADIRADTLLAPVNGSTYTSDEKDAARRFIVMATNPLPPQNLPVQLERTAGGQSFILAQRIAEAQMSVANFSLTAIFQNHAADDEDPSGLSPMGLIRKNVYDKFANPDWRKSLEGEVSIQKLLVQIALLLADKNYMDYQTYLQAERTEAIAATQLAIATRQYNEPVLASLRSAAAR
jgi:hypothetical protein